MGLFNKETVFQVPDVRRMNENAQEPPAVHRHYLVMRDAMLVNDRATVANRQLRLLEGGFEIPITIKQCNKLLKAYVNVT